MRDVGQLGERAFASWCTEGEITANPSQTDLHGWDWYLEFHSENNDGNSLDIQLASLECKVQIKSTDNQRKKEQISLSNLHRLIKTPMPVFFCLIEFNGNNKPVSAYLVHVGQKIIEHTLKKLREADISGEKDRINKKTITINFDDSHKLDNLDGISLKKAILSHVKNGLEEYINHKYNLVKSLGFEDGSVHITFETEENFDSLNDVFLGIKSEVSIKNLIATESRFGIKNPSPLFKLETSKLVIPNLPVFTEGKIIFREHLFSPGLSFPCKIYDSPLNTSLPPLNTSLPQEMFKFNVKGELFNFVVQPFMNRGKLSLSFSEDRRLGINTLINTAKLLLMVLNSTKKIMVEIDCDNFPQPICVNISSTTLNNSPHNKNSNIIEELNQELECLEKVKFICLFFEIVDTTSISLYEIHQSHKIINSINNMYYLLNKIENLRFAEDIMFCEFQNEASPLQAAGYQNQKRRSC